MRRVILALALVLAACGSSTADTGEATTSTTSTTPSTSTTTTSTTSTTSTTTTTTTQPPSPAGITRNTRFEPGTLYRGVFEGVEVEYQIRFQQDGWRVTELGINLGRSIHFENHRMSLEPGADIGMSFWMFELPTSEVAEWWLNNERVEATTEPQAVSLGGNPALQFDLLASPWDRPGYDPCGLDFVRIPTVDDGFDLDHAYLEGIFACTWTRIWVVDVDGRALTVAASAGLHELDPDQVRQIEEFEPLLDDFINAITFCTGVETCDD